MKIVHDYMPDSLLRAKLNHLTQEVFGFDFEAWFSGGFYEGDYIPYSFEDNGQLIANASANEMEFLQTGKLRHYIQIGTVMTKETHRKQGFARQLIQEILAHYLNRCDGIYLFGDLDAVGFYEKMGFTQGIQYRYILKEEYVHSLSMQQRMRDRFCATMPEQHREHYKETVRNSAVNSAFELKNKYGLQMFYTANMKHLYYCQELDCYIVMRMDNGILYLQSVISRSIIPLAEILNRIAMDYSALILGFTPRMEDSYLFQTEAFDGGNDYRFFYIGDALKSIEAQKLYFPVLSHA